MDGIRIEVTGNIARVIERPARITAGTVGLPVDFSFDSQWDGLSKTAVFRAGNVEKIVENLENEATVPWEALESPNVWLSIGVYGVNEDGTEAIPTIWANVCVICDGANPDGDVSTAPTLPVWQRLWNAIGNLLGLTTNAKGNLVEAINEVNSIALAGGIESDATLTKSGKAADAKATGDAIADARKHESVTGNPHRTTAADVGARPNTWLPSPKEIGAATTADLDGKVDHENGEAKYLTVKGFLNLRQSDQSNGVYFNPGIPGDSIVLEMLGEYQDEPVILRGLGDPEDGNDAVPLDYANDHYAPSGYGLGKGGKAIAAGDNLNNYKVGGWYQFTKGVTNAPCDYGMMMVIPGTGYANDTYQYVFSRYPAYKLYIRQLFEGTWQSWVECSPSAFAPSGYGYGGQAISLGHFTTEAALTTALASVYDAMSNHETKLISYSGYPSNSDWRWFGIIDRSSANNGSFVAHSVYNGGSKFIKQKYNGTWQECEWENPPMVAGTEYRTIHRYKGEPVYCKLIVQKYNTTIGAATGYSDYNIEHKIDGITRLLKVEANMNDTILLPYVAGAGGHTFILEDVSQTYFKLRVYCDTWASPTVALIAYYTR